MAVLQLLLEENGHVNDNMASSPELVIRRCHAIRHVPLVGSCIGVATIVTCFIVSQSLKHSTGGLTYVLVTKFACALCPISSTVRST